MTRADAIREILFPSNPLAQLMWAAIGLMLGWMIMDRIKSNR